MTEAVQRSLERAWAVEVDRALETLPQGFTALAQKLNARGLLKSGHHVRSIDQHAASVLTSVVNQMFERLVEANNSEQPNNVEDRIHVLQGLFMTRCREMHAQLEAHVHENNSKFGLPDSKKGENIRTTDLDRVLKFEVASLVERVRFVVTASAQKGTPMSTTINVSGGNVGSLAVGDGALAVSHQQVAQGVDSAAVVAALSEVIARIASSTAGTAQDRQSVAKLLEDLRAEADKPAPDKWKVFALIKGAGELIKFIPDAVAAWKTVSEWGSALG